jgi:ABC-type transport system involved in multi-copper enzyme maturation permease subunit
MNRLLSWPIARQTARERGLAPAPIGIALVLVLLAVATRPVSPGGWSGGASGFWLALLALVLGAGLLSSEVESGHAQLVLLRPITRAQWVGGRLVGAALVLCLAGAIAWAASLVAAVARGAFDASPPWFALLPVALLPHLGWLATLCAISAVTRGWTNAALLLALRFGWFFARSALPLALPQWNLGPWLLVADRYFGPQEPADAEGIVPSLLTWDALWLAAAWLAAVLLFNRRELARRRG